MDDINGIEQPALSFQEMGMDFTPMGLIKAADGVALYKLGADSQLFVEFYDRRVPEVAKSMNGAPSFAKVDYVKIYRPGDKCQVDRKAREEDKRRFPEHWYRYKNGQQQFVGTKIEVLQQQGLLTDPQIEMLKYAKIQSVEQLAAASELVVAGFGTEGEQMQKIAKGWLNFKAQVEGKEDYNRLKSQMEADRAEMAKQKDELAKQMEALKAMQERLATQEAKVQATATEVATEDTYVRRGPGRPRKDTSVTDT